MGPPQVKVLRYWDVQQARYTPSTGKDGLPHTHRGWWAAAGRGTEDAWRWWLGAATSVGWDF
eukprot:CAMPEP_0202916794 /NCGR_PEP_ID=MMETSP1392-20130828/69455_1 /ASSEMBLY_ACC=CAM_ASM_000868 /TAXON_ID=225041 /ORGANISM="Chlamydomonas chlamydogama, Strain SAG 11-48b" /LENGTH=61 /DNA_ID=CAMNT_0049609341 /DNA_START=73 /DNA_END=258 /DNA_ORIENTATION=+